MSGAKWLSMMGVESLSVVEITGTTLRLRMGTVWGPVRASGPSVQEAVLVALRAILKNATETADKTSDPDLRDAMRARAARVGALLAEADPSPG